MKKNYCEFCGQELEHGKCDCKGLEKLKEKGINIYNRQKKKCLYCKSTMYIDSNFCPRCGMPNDSVNVFDKNLQKELMGDEVINLSHINEEEIKKRKSIIEKQLNQSLKIKMLLMIIIILLSLILIFKYVIPFMKESIRDIKFRNEVARVEMEVIDDEEYETIKESKDDKTNIDLKRYKNEWVRKDGEFYAFDENGDPIVDEWIEEVDEKTGKKSEYYFDIEGKLATNTWVNNEYYVGADGKKLINTFTPDGVRVDKEGKAILETEPTTTASDKKVKKTEETLVFYDSPLDDGNIIQVEETTEIKSNKKSTSVDSTAGVISGSINKNAEIYLSSLKPISDETTKNNHTVSLKYYYPTVSGKDSAEIKSLNEKYKKYFETDFKKLISTYVADYQEDVLDVTLNTVEEMTLNKNRYWIKLTGKMLKASGKSVTLNFRIKYYRDTKLVSGEKMN